MPKREPRRIQARLRAPVTRTRAPRSRSMFAVASPTPLVLPMITTRFSSYRPIGCLFASPKHLYNF